MNQQVAQSARRHREKSNISATEELPINNPTGRELQLDLPEQAAAEIQSTERAALRVLVVEQGSGDAAENLAHELCRYGHAARSVDTGNDALQRYHEADLILLDLELPDLDGLEVCHRLRAISRTPIIIVTARGTDLDRVLGLRAGSDDYVVKPYCLRELLARIDAVMRRVRPAQQWSTQVITHGELRIDTSTREISMGGQQIRVTPKEFDLLHLLASQPGTTLSRRKLLSEVWDGQWSQRGRTIDTHVSSLRSKLGSSSWIVTVRGVGFRLGNF